jgi:hypothetical protein
MTYELIQSALTALINVTAIAGITGIAAHAFYTRHTRWMKMYCPPVAPCQPEVQAAVAPAAVEAVEVATTEQPEIQEEEVETAVAPAASEQPATEIDLNNLDPATLRKLCSQYKIQWRDVRGKNRHATKSMMIFQLNQKSAA